MRTGEILKTNANKYYAAAERVSKCNLYIDDSPGIKINDIVAKSRKLKNEDSLKSDIIGLLLGRCSTERDNCDNAITGTSNSLANAFKVLEISDTSCCLLSRFLDDDVINCK